MLTEARPGARRVKIRKMRFFGLQDALEKVAEEIRTKKAVF